MTGLGKGKVYYGWIVVLASLIMMASIFGARYSYGVFFKSLEHDFGWSRALTSGVFSAHMLLCSIFAICGGWALDRYGPRLVLLVMGLFTTSSFLLSSRADSLWELFFSYSLLLAIGTAPTYAVIMGLLSTAWNGGAAAGPALAGYLFDTTGNYLLAFLIGTVSLLILPALCFSMTIPKK